MIRLVVPAATCATVMIPCNPSTYHTANDTIGFVYIPDGDVVQSSVLDELQADFAGAFDIFPGKKDRGVLAQFDYRVNPVELHAWLNGKGFKTTTHEVSKAILHKFWNRHLGVTLHDHC